MPFVSFMAQEILRLLQCNGKEESYDEAALRQCVCTCPESCRQKFDFRGEMGVAYPLSRICQLQPSAGIVRLLHKAFPDAIRIPNDSGWLPLHVACRYRASFEVVQYIAEHNSRAVRATTKDGLLPLHMVLSNDAPTQLDPAFAARCLNVCKLLIQAYPESVETPEIHGWLPLHVVCKFQPTNLGVIKFLVSQNSECVKKATKRMWLPLHQVCRYQPSLPVIKYLVSQHPKSVEAVTKEGCLPLHLLVCTARPSLETVKYLVEQYPASVCQASNAGLLPLDLLAYYSKQPPLDVVCFLIAKYPGVFVDDETVNTEISHIKKDPVPLLARKCQAPQLLQLREHIVCKLKGQKKPNEGIQGLVHLSPDIRQLIENGITCERPISAAPGVSAAPAADVSPNPDACCETVNIQAASNLDETTALSRRASAANKCDEMQKECIEAAKPPAAGIKNEENIWLKHSLPASRACGWLDANIEADGKPRQLPMPPVDTNTDGFCAAFGVGCAVKPPCKGDGTSLLLDERAAMESHVRDSSGKPRKRNKAVSRKTRRPQDQKVLSKCLPQETIQEHNRGKAEGPLKAQKATSLQQPPYPVFQNRKKSNQESDKSDSLPLPGHSRPRKEGKLGRMRKLFMRPLRRSSGSPSPHVEDGTQMLLEEKRSNALTCMDGIGGTSTAQSSSASQNTSCLAKDRLEERCSSARAHIEGTDEAVANMAQSSSISKDASCLGQDSTQLLLEEKLRHVSSRNDLARAQTCVKGISGARPSTVRSPSASAMPCVTESILPIPTEFSSAKMAPEGIACNDSEIPIAMAEPIDILPSCSACGHNFDMGDRFCRSCGQAIPDASSNPPHHAL